MSFFEFPHTRTYDSDLGWLIRHVKENYDALTTLEAWAAAHKGQYQELENKVDGLINSLVEVIVPWDSSIAYKIFSIVEYQGTNYIALQDVPVGVMITNTDYWQPANTVIEQINAIGVMVDQIRQNLYYVTPEDYGAAGDGVTDDKQAILDAIDSGKPVIFADKTYAVNGQLLIDDKDGVMLIGYGTTIKNTGSDELVNANDCFIEITDSSNIIINGITVDAGVEFRMRPVYGDPGVTADTINTWVTFMQTKIHGIGIKRCTDVYISDCIVQFARSAYFLSGCTNGHLTHNASVQCLADGVFVTGGSRRLNIIGHTCDYVQDDQYACLGYFTDEAQNPANVVYMGCTATNCYGALTCLEGSSNTLVFGCSSLDNRAEPVKLGNLIIGSTTIRGYNQRVIGCQVRSISPQETHYISDPGFVNIVSGTNGNEPYDITIDGCEFNISKATEVRLQMSYTDNVIIRNCTFNTGFNFHHNKNLKLFNNIIKAKSGSVINLGAGFDCRGNRIDNDVTFAGATKRSMIIQNTTGVVFLDNTGMSESDVVYDRNFPFIYALSNTAADGMIANTPFELQITGTGSLTNMEYRGIFNAFDATEPAYTVFKPGTLVSSTAGLKYRGYSGYKTIETYP